MGRTNPQNINPRDVRLLSLTVELKLQRKKVLPFPWSPTAYASFDMLSLSCCNSPKSADRRSRGVEQTSVAGQSRCRPRRTGRRVELCLHFAPRRRVLRSPTATLTRCQSRRRSTACGGKCGTRRGTTLVDARSQACGKSSARSWTTTTRIKQTPKNCD